MKGHIGDREDSEDILAAIRVTVAGGSCLGRQVTNGHVLMGFFHLTCF